MKYVTPKYTNEIIESTDVILTSIDLGGATLTQIDSTTAKVSASVSDILGLR